MFLRCALTKLPRITRSIAVRSCTSQIKPLGSESSSPDWIPIYKFPAMKFLSQLSKLKVLQAAFTSAGVPLLMGLESFQIVPTQTTALFAVIGITGTITLSVYSLCSTKIIGFVYVNPILKQIRFSYLDFWGRRKNQDLTLDELVSSNEKRIFNLYTVLKTTTATGSLKLLTHGIVIDADIFYRLFGDI